MHSSRGVWQKKDERSAPVATDDDATDVTDIEALLALSEGPYSGGEERTQVYVRAHLPPTATHVQPETLRPVEIATAPAAIRPSLPPTTKLPGRGEKRSSGTRMLLAASFVVTVGALAFAFSSRTAPASQCAAAAPEAPAAIATQVAPLSTPPPAAIPKQAAAPAIPVTSIDALPTARTAKPNAKGTAARRAAKGAPLPVVADPYTPSAPSTPVVSAPPKPRTEGDQAREAADLARQQLEAALR